MSSYFKYKEVKSENLISAGWAGCDRSYFNNGDRIIICTYDSGDISISSLADWEKMFQVLAGITAANFNIRWKDRYPDFLRFWVAENHHNEVQSDFLYKINQLIIAELEFDIANSSYTVGNFIS